MTAKNKTTEKKSGKKTKIDAGDAELQKQADKRINKQRRTQPENVAFSDVSTLLFKTDLNLSELTIPQRKMMRQIALVMLSQGYFPSEIAEASGIPLKTIALWKSQMTQQELAVIDEMIVKNVGTNMSVFLNSSLVSMARVAHYCSKPEYLDKHNPEQIARLLEVIGNHSFRLIEAKQRVELAKINAQQQRIAEKYEPETAVEIDPIFADVDSLDNAVDDALED